MLIQLIQLPLQLTNHLVTAALFWPKFYWSLFGPSSQGRSILTILREKSMKAGEIADHFNISKPSISHHLEILRNADLVSSEKKGQFVVYSINTTIMEDVLEWILTLKK